MANKDFHICSECLCNHTHPYPQVIMPLDESLSISIGCCDYVVSPEELCYIPPETIHTCQIYSRLLVLNIPLELLQRKDTMLLSHPLIVPLRKELTQLVKLIQSELEKNPEGEAIYHLYCYLYSKLVEKCETASMRYVNKHYDENITVAQLAELENFNASYFNDWFKQQTGLPPNLYLRCVRISKAKELLLTTDYNIMEIAVMVGYSSNSTLTRAFHSITGVTPKEFREQALLEKTG